MTPEDFDKFVSSAIWTFAKTMPNNPHFWTLKKDFNTEVFINVVDYINENFQIMKFGSRDYKIHVVHGCRYWTMDEDLKKVTLINRAIHNPEPYKFDRSQL